MFRTLTDLQSTDTQGRVVFVRGDLNVPMQDGVVSDTTRLERLAPTIKALVDMEMKVVVLSHFGRPKGNKNPEMTLKPVAVSLGKVLGCDVKFADDCIGEIAKQTISAMNNGDVTVLENVRFYAGEENNDSDFAKEIASNGDVFVNDAFSVSHRAHASTHAIATILPAYAGLNMQMELDALTNALEKPQRPVMAIVGGSKVSSKLDVLTNLVKSVDKIVIGGGMANTFLHAQGINIGKSLCEKELAQTAREIMQSAQENNCEIILPSDASVSDNITNGENAETKSINEISETDMILDIGQNATNDIIAKLGECKTLIWNGPVGAFEFSPFERGTMQIADAVVEQTQNSGLVSVAGGGDTVSALAMANAKDKVTYVSTAGGAFLEWMEGKVLPGVDILKK